jgi:N-acetylglucosaminyl-diphospho-decaprenol L-rhamnosyltransferase
LASDPTPVEVLIPNWNRVDLLREVLASLAEQTLAPQVCVIDNGSTDGSAEAAEAEFPGTRVVGLDRNVGFGAALNEGVRTGNAELLIFLNNDAVADPHFVERLVAAQRRTGAEMVAGCLRRPDGSVDSFGIEIDPTLAGYDAGWSEPYGAEAHRLVQPLAPSGGAAMFTRDAFEAVGGFDERIFAYFEDVDLGIRMRMRGYRCRVAYDAFAWHRGSDTLGSGSRGKNRMIARSRGYILWKWGRNLGRAPRLRGWLTDLVVYCGQAVVDRNTGALAGRLAAHRELRGLRRPGAEAEFARVPVTPLGLRAGLKRRRARRLQRLSTSALSNLAVSHSAGGSPGPGLKSSSSGSR